MRIDAIPIWAVFTGTIISAMVAIEVGYWLGRAMHRRSEDEKESPVSAIAGAILGLAAFMLAFTFGIVSERHDAKKALVRDDAIAIRTIWQRSDFLPETDRAEAAALLRQYVDVRVTFAEEGSVEAERVKSVLAETQRIQDRTAVDWLPTLASLVGESRRVPADRPIDGVDASAFLLGDSPTTGRDHVIYYGSDAGVMSVKWRTMKVVFRYSESTSGPIIKPQWPLVFDLIDDPVEEWDLIEKRLDCAWVMAPVAERLGALQQSMARYPNIKPGEEFTGY